MAKSEKSQQMGHILLEIPLKKQGNLTNGAKITRNTVEQTRTSYQMGHILLETPLNKSGNPIQ